MQRFVGIVNLTNSISVALDISVSLPDCLPDKLKDCVQMPLDLRLMPPL